MREKIKQHVLDFLYAEGDEEESCASEYEFTMDEFTFKLEVDPCSEGTFCLHSVEAEDKEMLGFVEEIMEEKFSEKYTIAKFGYIIYNYYYDFLDCEKFIDLIEDFLRVKQSLLFV